MVSLTNAYQSVDIKLMPLIRLACAVYWSFLTVLLLAPEPVKLLGLKSAAVASINRGSHFVFFLTLAVLVSASRWPIRRSMLALTLVGYAFVTEGLQWFVPTRHVDPLDLIENLAGLLAGILIWQTLRRTAAKGRPYLPLTGQAPDNSAGNS